MAASGLAASKKGARRSGRAIVFVDETGHTFRATFGTTWAPIGRPPVLRRVSKRREISSIVGLVAPIGGQAHLYARHFSGTIHAGQIILALRYFRQRIGRAITVVWDRSNVHRATTVDAFVRAHPNDYQIEWLPPYAPELNPEELCNGAVKQAMRNALPASVDELRHSVRRNFIRLGKRHSVLHGFFDHVGLSGDDIT